MESESDTRGAFDDLHRSLAAVLEREPGSPLLVRASFETLLGAFITRAQQHRGEMALVIFELEGDKAVRESAGAADFERAIADLGRELRRRLRACDEIGRLGEAQIAAVLPGCDEPSLNLVAERLRVALEGAELSLGSRRVSPSLVMAAIPAPLGPASSAERALEELDRALDRARGAGSA